MAKINTQEQAEQSIKDAFSQMGLNDDGTTKDGEAPSFKQATDTFKKAGQIVREEWTEESIGEAEEGDVEEYEAKETPQSNAELLKAQQELQSRDEAMAKMQKLIDELSEKTNKQAKAERERVLENIEQQRRQAVSQANYEAVLQLDKQKEQVLGVNTELDPVYRDFLQRNTWWNGTSAQDLRMRAKANDFDRILTQQGHHPHEIVRRLEAAMTEEYPDYYGKSDKKEHTKVAVEGNVKAGIVKDSKRQYNASNLSKEAKFIAKEFERLKVLKTDKYIEELNKSGVIK